MCALGFHSLAHFLGHFLLARLSRGTWLIRRTTCPRSFAEVITCVLVKSSINRSRNAGETGFGSVEFTCCLLILQDVAL